MLCYITYTSYLTLELQYIVYAVSLKTRTPLFTSRDKSRAYLTKTRDPSAINSSAEFTVISMFTLYVGTDQSGTTIKCACVDDLYVKLRATEV